MLFFEFLVNKEENAQKFCENFMVDKKSAYVIYEWSPRSSEDIFGGESQCHFGKYVLLKNLNLISSKSQHKRTKKTKSSTIPVRDPQEEL